MRIVVPLPIILKLHRIERDIARVEQERKERSRNDPFLDYPVKKNSLEEKTLKLERAHLRNALAKIVMQQSQKVVLEHIPEHTRICTQPQLAVTEREKSYQEIEREILARHSPDPLQLP